MAPPPKGLFSGRHHCGVCVVMLVVDGFSLASNSRRGRSVYSQRAAPMKNEDLYFYWLRLDGRRQNPGLLGINSSVFSSAVLQMFSKDS